MPLIKSISGIRGTIGGRAGEGLSPLDVVKFTAAYGEWIKRRAARDKQVIITGRDARTTGEMLSKLVSSTLIAMGIDVIDLGLATTPSVEIAVPEEGASGGIILTASHNPAEWNALKLLNEDGEFLTADDGKRVLEIAENTEYSFTGYDTIGSIKTDNSYKDKHIEKILSLPVVDTESISKAGFTVAIDCVNSVGGIIIPDLLGKLGVKNIIQLYTEPNGRFPHNPEPLPENIKELSKAVRDNQADVGFVVDPDVDRLAIVSEDGSFFNEEYTIVACSDYILSETKLKSNTVSNMSSSRALRDVTEKHGGRWYPSAVGEINTVIKMKEVDAVIGGEGNGGVIYPAIHYGRDALVGIALFLSLMARSGKSCTQLKAGYPEYIISKNKVELTKEIDPEEVLKKISQAFANYIVSTEDGVLLEKEKGWIHVRKSNTEPILRIYSEGKSREEAENLAMEIIKFVKK